MCRDHAANVLFEDSEEDQPIPTYILEALLKVWGGVVRGGGGGDWTGMGLGQIKRL